MWIKREKPSFDLIWENHPRVFEKQVFLLRNTFSKRGSKGLYCLADHLVSSQIPLGPTEILCATLSRKWYSRSRSGCYNKMTHMNTWTELRVIGIDPVAGVREKIISKTSVYCGRYSWKTRYDQLSWQQVWTARCLGRTLGCFWNLQCPMGATTLWGTNVEYTLVAYDYGICTREG